MPQHILVVDDAKESADLTAKVIKKLSGDEFTAEAVYGGQECLDRLEKQPAIDLILLDLDMPVVNGANVIRAILKHNPSPAFKILLTTGWGPNWEKHWKLGDIINTVPFKNLVWPKTSDKNSELEELISMIREILGPSEKEAA